jgi:hypothetical protein
MPVHVKQSWTISYDNKDWKVPEDFVQVVQDKTFVKLAGSNGTFSNFLVPGTEKFQKNLSLSQSPGYKGLQNLRNSASTPEEEPENHLFGSPKGKKRAKKSTTNKTIEIVTMVIPEMVGASGGNVLCLSSSHPLQDVWVQLDPEGLELCFRYMRSEGLEISQKRRYASDAADEGQTKLVSMGSGRKAVKQKGEDGRATYKYMKADE